MPNGTKGNTLKWHFFEVTYSPLGSVGHEKTNGLDLLMVPDSEATDTSYVLAGWNPDIIIYCSSFPSTVYGVPVTFTSTSVHTPSGLFQTI